MLLKKLVSLWDSCLSLSHCFFFFSLTMASLLSGSMHHFSLHVVCPGLLCHGSGPLHEGLLASTSIADRHHLSLFIFQKEELVD
jgi:hypothetical protein